MQGHTSERVLIHADSHATNFVDQKMLYVAVSRAEALAGVYTDDCAKLPSAIRQRAGERWVAFDSSATPIRASAATAAKLLRSVGLG